jgi:hypothetical protein
VLEVVTPVPLQLDPMLHTYEYKQHACKNGFIFLANVFFQVVNDARLGH